CATRSRTESPAYSCTTTMGSSRGGSRSRATTRDARSSAARLEPAPRAGPGRPQPRPSSTSRSKRLHAEVAVDLRQLVGRGLAMSGSDVTRRLRAAVKAMREASFHPPPTQQSVLATLGAELPDAPYVVDVGANVGRWAEAMVANRPSARIIMVEAQAELMPE